MTNPISLLLLLALLANQGLCKIVCYTCSGCTDPEREAQVTRCPVDKCGRIETYIRSGMTLTLGCYQGSGALGCRESSGGARRFYACGQDYCNAEGEGRERAPQATRTQAVPLLLSSGEAKILPVWTSAAAAFAVLSVMKNC